MYDASGNAASNTNSSSSSSNSNGSHAGGRDGVGMGRRKRSSVVSKRKGWASNADDVQSGATTGTNGGHEKGTNKGRGEGGSGPGPGGQEGVWSDMFGDNGLPENAPIVVILHGIGGRRDDAYVKRSVLGAAARSWRPVVYSYWRLDWCVCL